MRVNLFLLLGAALLASGCRNACQKICKDMAEYAEECGYTVTDEDLKECYKSQKGSESRDDRAVCRAFNDEEQLRAEWSCEDLEDYLMEGNTDPVDTAEGDTGN